MDHDRDRSLIRAKLVYSQDGPLVATVGSTLLLLLPTYHRRRGNSSSRSQRTTQGRCLQCPCVGTKEDVPGWGGGCAGAGEWSCIAFVFILRGHLTVSWHLTGTEPLFKTIITLFCDAYIRHSASMRWFKNNDARVRVYMVQNFSCRLHLCSAIYSAIYSAWTWSAHLRRICGYRDILAYNGTEPPARMMITTETDMDFFYFETFFFKIIFQHGGRNFAWYRGTVISW